MNARTLFGLLLFVGALTMGQRVLEANAARTTVWVAARPLGAAARVDAGDLRPALVQLPADQIGLYARGETALTGMYVTRSLEPGEMNRPGFSGGS